VDPYVYMIPPLGPHYSTLWAEQDRLQIATPGYGDDTTKGYTTPGATRGLRMPAASGGRSYVRACVFARQ
jgi:hypothetical protein